MKEAEPDKQEKENDKEEVGCRRDVRADGAICQRHLSPGSPAAASLTVIAAT